MAYIARIIKIFIASPSDTEMEREAFCNVIHAWNYAHSEVEETVLHPVRWEAHSYALSGKHPQEILNSQIVDTCDAVIGIFKSKLGTPTKTAESGAVEEINKLRSLGKPISLYFSNEFTAETAPNREQFTRLLDFKKRCQSTSYYFEYSNVANLAQKLQQQLPGIVTRAREIVEAILQLDDGISNANKRISGSDLSDRQAAILYAAKSGDGYVISSGYIGGFSISAGNTSIYRGNDQREISAWTEALEDLSQRDFLRATSRDIYQLTSKGYDRADTLEKKL